MRDRPADTDARSLMWEWCHRLKDREAAVQAVIRHLGEAPVHAKDYLHAKTRELLQLTWVEIVWKCSAATMLNEPSCFICIRCKVSCMTHIRHLLQQGSSSCACL